MTRLAPASMCVPADGRLVNSPVDSMTTSTSSLSQGRSFGSRSASTVITPVSRTMEPSATFTSPPSRPWVES